MTGVSFLEIYTMAITEFQDPTLKALYNTNILLFTQVMNNFMVNAISLFSSPLAVRTRLAKTNAAYELQEKFVGDGITNEFIIMEPPIETDLWNIVIQYTVDGKRVDGKYDENTNIVVLSEIPDEFSEIIIDFYYVGSFEIDLYPEERFILSQWIMVAWSEYVQNNKLDIDRLLGDSDFKLTSNATTTNAKSSWFIVNRETVEKRMMKYSWDSAMLGTYR